MVAFEKPPTDEELRSFADPEGTPPYVRLDDDGTTLTARPQPIPSWFIATCLLVPTAVAVGALIWENPFDDPDPLVRLMGFLFAAAIPLTVIPGWFVVRWITRVGVRQDDFFVLDRAAGTLALPRAGVTLRRDELVELVEVHGWYWRMGGEGPVGEYIRELSVLARGSGGTLVRYPVVAAMHAKPVGRVAAELAELFGVPRRKLVEGMISGRWRRAE